MDSEIVLELPPSERNPRNSEGAFADLPDGRLLFVYTRFYGGAGDDAAAELAACRSADDGQTWEVLREPVVPNEGDENVMSVSFLRLGDELLLFYLVKNRGCDCRLYCRRSRDGQTWSASACCLPTPGYFVVNNDRLLQLRSGRILAPASQHVHEAEKGWHPGELWMFRSDDQARTWQAAGPVLPPFKDGAGLQEPGVIELQDGRLWMHARTDTGRHWQSFSTDAGLTWSAATPTEFAAPCSPLCIKRIPGTTDLLAVWNDHSGRFPHPERPAGGNFWQTPSAGRTPLVAAVSHDDGRTWTGHRAIESDFDHGYCYTAIHFRGEHVFLAYCAGGPEFKGVLNRLRIRRLSRRWLCG